MTDLERFFRQLVHNLAATDPARLRRPISVADVSGSILPYRANRRALQLDTSEDYELVLMRLCAGEGGFAHAEPEEARAGFERELQSPNPDLEALRRYEMAHLVLAPDAVAAALADAPDVAATVRALPERIEALAAAPGPTPLPRSAPARSASAPPAASTGVLCAFCGGALPTDRLVNFCPHCGQSQTQGRCPECGSDLERGWRHCVNCGATVERADAIRRRPP